MGVMTRSENVVHTYVHVISRDAHWRHFILRSWAMKFFSRHKLLVTIDVLTPMGKMVMWWAIAFMCVEIGLKF